MTSFATPAVTAECRRGAYVPGVSVLGANRSGPLNWKALKNAA